MSDDGGGSSVRFRNLLDRMRATIDSDRAEEIRTRITDIRNRVEASVEKEGVRRVQSEVSSLGSDAMRRLDKAVTHEGTRNVLQRIDATITNIGTRVRGDVPDEDPTDEGTAEPEDSDSKSGASGS